MTPDDIRTRYPAIGFAIYAIEPGKAVTLETHAPDGQVFSFRGATVADAIGKAFPDEPEPAAPADIFD